MSRIWKSSVLSCIALAGWMILAQDARAAVPVVSAATPIGGLRAVADFGATLAVEDVDDGAESNSHRTNRMNRNLLIGTVSILTVFVIFRLLLVWQISRNRRKTAQNNLLEGEA